MERRIKYPAPIYDVWGDARVLLDMISIFYEEIEFLVKKVKDILKQIPRQILLQDLTLEYEKRTREIYIDLYAEIGIDYAILRIACDDDNGTKMVLHKYEKNLEKAKEYLLREASFLEEHIKALLTSTEEVVLEKKW